MCRHTQPPHFEKLGQSASILDLDGFIIFSILPKAYVFFTFNIRTSSSSPIAVSGTKTAIPSSVFPTPLPSAVAEVIFKFIISFLFSFITLYHRFIIIIFYHSYAYLAIQKKSVIFLI